MRAGPALPCRRPRRLERARRALLPLRVRDLHAGVPAVPADAEDVFQEVFTRVYDDLDCLRDDSALRPWIGQLTRRLCLDSIAASGRTQPAADVEPADHERTLDEVEEAFAVREALAELSSHCQEMLDRFFSRDESYRTISQDLDLPSGTIASRISRCLRQLRVQLEGEEMTAPAGLGVRW